MERAYSRDVTQKIELPPIVFALKLKSPAWHTSTNQGSGNHAIKQIIVSRGEQIQSDIPVISGTNTYNEVWFHQLFTRRVNRT